MTRSTTDLVLAAQSHLYRIRVLYGGERVELDAWDDRLMVLLYPGRAVTIGCSRQVQGKYSVPGVMRGKVGTVSVSDRDILCFESDIYAVPFFDLAGCVLTFGHHNSPDARYTALVRAASSLEG